MRENGDVVDGVPPVQVESGMAGVVGDDDDWNLGDIPLSKDADV